VAAGHLRSRNRELRDSSNAVLDLTEEHERRAGKATGVHGPCELVPSSVVSDGDVSDC
jgi:hypothetical protein